MATKKKMSALQMQYFGPKKKRKTKTHKAKQVSVSKMVRNLPKAKEVRNVTYNIIGGKTMAKKRTHSKVRRHKKTVAKHRSVKQTHTARRRMATSARRHYRRARHSVARVGGLISSNKKESLMNLAALGAGFIGAMAVVNLAPLPAGFKNAKWKGGAIAAVTILGALKVRDRKAQLALAGIALYGLVDLAKSYIPQLATLSGYDSQRALVLSGAVVAPQSRARMAVGGVPNRTLSVGAGQARPVPQIVRQSAMTVSSGGYKTSSGSYAR